MTKPEYVNCHGEPVSLERIATVGLKPKESKDAQHRQTHQRDEAKLSMGFVVTARPSDFMEDVRRAYQVELDLNKEKPKEVKHPGDIEGFTIRWKRKNKPQKLHSKPYPIESAANTCAELARKAGWLEVDVTELLKT